MRRVLYILCMIVLVSGCGSLRKSEQHSSNAGTEAKDPLTYEQRRKYDMYLMEAVRMKHKGEYDAAFELLQHCLDLYPNSAVTLYEVSRFYMALGQEEKGVDCLKKAVALEKGNYWYKQDLASYYQNKRDWKRAIMVYEDMSQQFPARLEPLMSLVDLYQVNKQYQEVINVLNRLEKLDGKSEQISMEKFRMYLTVDNKDMAFKEIEALSKEYPFDMRYKRILGDVYMENNKPQEAYNVYNEILTEDPNYAPAMLSLANYFQKTGQDSLYHIQVDSILLNTNVETAAKMELMRQEIIKSERSEVKDSTKIIALFDKIMERPMPDANIPMLYSEYLIMKKMKKESVPVLNKVLELDPENKPARLQLLSYALSDNNLDEVIEVATPALDYNPDAMEFYYYLGLAHYQKDNKDKALEVFLKGVKQVNEKTDKNLISDFYTMIGDIYNAKEMRAQAYAAYDSSLVYNDNNIATLNNYAYFLSVDNKDLDKAEEMSYRTIKAEPENVVYLDTYAWILFMKGKYTEARIYIDQVINSDKDSSPEVWEHCGDIYFKLGDTKKALEYWKKAEKTALATKEESDKMTEKELKHLQKKIRLKTYLPK